MAPQYYDTKCLICETTIHAPVENYVCNICHNDDYSTVADFIVKQNNRIAALEAQNEKLVNALNELIKRASQIDERLLAATGNTADCEIGEIKRARAVLAEVTK